MRVTVSATPFRGGVISEATQFSGIGEERVPEIYLEHVSIHVERRSARGLLSKKEAVPQGKTTADIWTDRCRRDVSTTVHDDMNQAAIRVKTRDDFNRVFFAPAPSVVSFAEPNVAVWRAAWTLGFVVVEAFTLKALCASGFPLFEMLAAT